MTTLITRTHEDVLIAYFQDARIIDAKRIQGLGEELAELVANPRYEKIILNFQNVSFMSSAMISKLIHFGKRCKASDTRLCFCDINENIEQIFEVMQLGKVFAVSQSEDKAIEEIGKTGWFS